MTPSDPTPLSGNPPAADLDELFRDAPVLTSPHDMAAPELFPDDAEFEEFLVSVRADRSRDLT
jgi:hypothetical protein